MKEQTAVEWLEFEINRRGPKEDNPPQWLKELYEQAKAMEKQQIEETFSNARKNKSDCQIWNCEGSQKTYETFEQYYNETFKTK